MKMYLALLSLSLVCLPALAMAPSQGGEGGSPFGPLFLIAAIFAVMYFFMIRPQQKQQKKKQEMLTTLKPGDRIVSSGGIYGEIKQVKEHSVRVQIDDHTRVELAKTAVASVLEPQSDESK